MSEAAEDADDPWLQNNGMCDWTLCEQVSGFKVGDCIAYSPVESAPWWLHDMRTWITCMFICSYEEVVLYKHCGKDQLTGEHISPPLQSFFNWVPSSYMRLHIEQEKQGRLVFMHSLRTPSKQQNLSQRGIFFFFSGKQVSSHSILYKSKHISGLGLRTMALEWDGVHFPARRKRNGRPDRKRPRSASERTHVRRTRRTRCSKMASNRIARRQTPRSFCR